MNEKLLYNSVNNPVHKKCVASYIMQNINTKKKCTKLKLSNCTKMEYICSCIVIFVSGIKEPYAQIQKKERF